MKTQTAPKKKTPAKRKINVPLLRRIQVKARKYPETIMMENWGEVVKKDDAHPCGAVGCIAGTALLLEKPKRFAELCKQLRSCYYHASYSFREEGAALLGLGTNEAWGYQADRLFLTYCWPGLFRDEWNSAETPEEHADIFCRRIDHFIKTKGAE